MDIYLSNYKEILGNKHQVHYHVFLERVEGKTQKTSTISFLLQNNKSKTNRKNVEIQKIK